MEYEQAKGLLQEAGVVPPKTESPEPIASETAISEKGRQRWTTRFANWLKRNGDYIAEAGIVVFLSVSTGLAAAGINAPFSQDSRKFLAIAAGTTILTGVVIGMALAYAERRRTRFLDRYFKP